MNENPKPIIIPPRILPRDFLDVCICLLVGLFQTAILFGLPALLAYILTHSLVIAFIVVCAAYGFCLLFVVRCLTVSVEGLRFHRVLGSPKFLPWERISSVQMVSRSELILRGWLWPLFPSREIAPSLSAIQHFRISWDSGFCYYPPADPKLFEQHVVAKLPNRSARY